MSATSIARAAKGEKLGGVDCPVFAANLAKQTFGRDVGSQAIF
jgi:hypothetical protein